MSTIHVKDEWKARAKLTDDQYQDWYRRSVEDPDGFWGEHGKRLDWIKPYERVKNTSFAPGNIDIRWSGRGTTRPIPRRSPTGSSMRRCRAWPMS